MSDCPLNETELSIVVRLAEGKTAKEISNDLGLAYTYVSDQMKLARRVAKVSNTRALVAVAVRQGWIT